MHTESLLGRICMETILSILNTERLAPMEFYSSVRTGWISSSTILILVEDLPLNTTLLEEFSTFTSLLGVKRILPRLPGSTGNSSVFQQRHHTGHLGSTNAALATKVSGIPTKFYVEPDFLCYAQDFVDVANVITNYSAAGIPLETMWTDIGMMEIMNHLVLNLRLA